MFTKKSVSFQRSLKNKPASQLKWPSNSPRNQVPSRFSNLLKTQPDIDDINNILVDIKKDMDSKTDLEVFEKILSEQATINEVLCSENIVAKFVWRADFGGAQSNLESEPPAIELLEKQNTMKEIFEWEEGMVHLGVAEPGFYQVLVCAVGLGKSERLDLLANESQLKSRYCSESESSVHVKWTGFLEENTALTLGGEGQFNEGILFIRKI